VKKQAYRYYNILALDYFDLTLSAIKSIYRFIINLLFIVYECITNSFY